MRQPDADPSALQDRSLRTGLESLTAILATLGIQCLECPSGTDGAILALPESGRVVGLWPYRRGENLLWVNPEFTGRLQIGAKDSRWIEPGGDRMWLSPAREFLRGGTGEDRSPPPALDPGRYAGVRQRGEIRMENAGEVLAAESGERVAFRLTRGIRPLSEAELAERWGRVYLRNAGYEEEATLEIARGCGVRVSLWNSVQVRAGGAVWLPLSKHWGDTRLAALPPGIAELESGCAVLTLRGTPRDLAAASRDSAMREPLRGTPRDLAAASRDPRGLRVGITEAEAGSLMFYLDRLDADRSSLLVRQLHKEPTAGSPAEDLSFECGCGPEADQAELSSFSPSVGGARRSAHKVVWRTSVAGFAGRRTEVEAHLARIIGKARTPGSPEV